MQFGGSTTGGPLGVLRRRPNGCLSPDSDTLGTAESSVSGQPSFPFGVPRHRAARGRDRRAAQGAQLRGRPARPLRAHRRPCPQMGCRYRPGARRSRSNCCSHHGGRSTPTTRSRPAQGRIRPRSASARPAAHPARPPSLPIREAGDDRARSRPRPDPPGHGAHRGRCDGPARGHRRFRRLPDAAARPGRPGAPAATAAAVRRPGRHPAQRCVPPLGGAGRPHAPAGRSRQHRGSDARHTRPLACHAALAGRDTGPPPDDKLGDRGQRGPAAGDTAGNLDRVRSSAHTGPRAHGARPRGPRVGGVLRQRCQPAGVLRPSHRRRVRPARLRQLRLVRRPAARPAGRPDHRLPVGLLRPAGRPRLVTARA